MWRGCEKIAPGCDNCYAASMANINPAVLGVWGPDGTRVVAAEKNWKELEKWNAAVKPGEDRFVFVASLSDVFEDWNGMMTHHSSPSVKMWKSKATGAWGAGVVCDEPEKFDPLRMSDVRKRLFDVVDRCSKLTFLFVTKRPQNVRRFWEMVIEATLPDIDPGEWERRNVWIGYSVACQGDVAGIPALLECRSLCSKVFLSLEPLIGPVDLHRFLFVGEEGGVEWVGAKSNLLDWLIVGGESGDWARPCDINWIRSLIEQGRSGEVDVWVKQLGSFVIDNCSRSRCLWPAMTEFKMQPDGQCRVLLKHPKGGDVSEWPEDVKVFQRPKGVVGCNA